jgi:uncharacterized NAD(P)/FAD-binding protein YdhS
LVNDNGGRYALAHGGAGDETAQDNLDRPSLLTLLILSFGAALVPWFGQANVGVSLAFSLVSLALPAAAFRAASRDGDQDEAEVEWPPPGWTRRAPPARPAPPRRRDVAIVGGGFSGTMLAVHLARAEGMRVSLIERDGAPGRGLAYAAANSNHLLNVRAERMSAYPEDPGHFVRWLAARELGEAGDFAPRRAYGLYLEQQLRQAHADVFPRLKLMTGEAIGVEGNGDRQRVKLDDGRTIDADTVVLATGNPPPPRLVAFDGLPSHLYAPDPWRDGLADGLGRDDPVLLVGTGLSMADAAVSLADAGFEGRIVAVSRRGLLPRAHAESPPAPVPQAFVPCLPLAQRLAAFRTRAADVGWRTAMDELRPQTQTLWKALNAAEKARFLRHLRPWWDVHRHRIAPEIAARLDALRAAGRFETAACSILGAEPRYGRVAVSLRPRGADRAVRIEVARVVNCAGSDGDLRHADDPLLRSLLAAGSIRADAQRLGMDTGRHGEAIGADGFVTPGLYALGPLARGRLWEATAVPELRAQAAAMAALIAAEAYADARFAG